MKNVYRVSASILAGLSLVGGTDPVWAMGFGRPVSRAVLGETLSVTVPVRLEAAEELADDCVAADVYFGDDKLAGSAVRTTIEPGASAQERTLRVATTSLINEPVVTVYVAAGCKAKVTRKFVAFADPPGLSMPAVNPPVAETAPAAVATQTAQAAPTSVAGGTVRATPLAPVSAKASQPASRARARQQTQASAAGEPALAAAARAPTAADGAGRSPAAVRPSERLSARVDNRATVSSGSRLELDPVEADAVVSPELAMTSTLMVSGDPDSPEAAERRAAAAALWAAMNASPEQLARDRQRMQDLEQRLARLQQDAEGARKRVADMEARVREAEGQRLRHPVVYALVGACLLLAGGVAWLFMRQRRQQDAQQSWWQGSELADAPETAPAATLAEPALARTSAEFMPVRTVTPEPAAAPAVAEPMAARADTPVPDVAARLATVPIEPAFAAARTQPVVLKSEAQEAVREITVEELIDLEQQAEFFVVLGQDEAAIELLESHVQTTAGASPLPYLKLLEIYQRLGRRDDYARVQSAFNSRFNAYAPSWESDLQHGHSLEEYPGVVERIEALWSQPGKAMELLQMSLTRPDDSVETFDLPAYRELLFLYAVARDLSERESQDRKAVDLLAPPGGATVVEPPVPHFEPLMATRPVKALPEATPSLSLDLSLDDPVPSGPGAFVEDPMAHMDIDLDATGLDSHGRGADAPSGPAGPQSGSIDFEAVDVSSLKR